MPRSCKRASPSKARPSNSSKFDASESSRNGLRLIPRSLKQPRSVRRSGLLFYPTIRIGVLPVLRQEQISTTSFARRFARYRRCYCMKVLWCFRYVCQHVRRRIPRDVATSDPDAGTGPLQRVAIQLRRPPRNCSDREGVHLQQVARHGETRWRRACSLRIRRGSRRSIRSQADRGNKQKTRFRSAR